MLAAFLTLALTADPSPRGMKGDADPEGLRDARDVLAELVAFTGKSVTVTLRAKKHRLVIRGELPDLVVEGGSHTLVEKKPRMLPSPLLVAECSKVNEPDGALHVLGTAGVKVKGPKTLAVLAVEPFPGPMPAARGRMVMDNGLGVLTAITTDVLLSPEDYRYLVVDRLDPASTYRVRVGGKPGLEQVVVATERIVGLGDGEGPADATWGKTRMVLKGGMSAELPPTAKVAFILAGVRGLHEDRLNLDERKVEVTVELIKGTVVDAAPTGPEGERKAPDKAILFTTTMARQLLADGSADAAKPLIRQCLAKDPRNAECHLLLAQASQLLEDRPTALKHACLAAKYGEGDLAGQNAKEMLGGDTSRCANQR